MVPYPRLAQFNYLQRPKTPLVCILRRNQGGGGVVKQPSLNMYIKKGGERSAGSGLNERFLSSASLLLKWYYILLSKYYKVLV